MRNGYAERPLQRNMLTVKGRLQDVDMGSVDTFHLSRFWWDSGSMMSEARAIFSPSLGDQILISDVATYCKSGYRRSHNLLKDNKI